ncbi:MAG: class I adenylate-forming enzyme family protein [Patescibacteria group bacterium]
MSVKNENLIRVDQSLLCGHQKIDRDFFIKHNNVYELFNTQAKKHPQKIFAIFPESNKTFSYVDFEKKIIEKASYLKANGILKGKRICLVLPTSPDFLALYFAAFKEGITVVPINPDLSSSEIAYIVADSQAKVVFYSKTIFKKIIEAQRMFSQNFITFTDISDIKLTTATEHTKTSNVRYKYGDEAVIIYTSGTTGKPKGAVLSHLNLLVNSQVISDWFKFTPDTRTLCILPLFHNNGQVVTLLAPLNMGGSTVMVRPKTGLKSFWSLIKEYNVSWTSVMPAILSMILAAKLERKDSSMVGIICGGQVLNEEVKIQFEKKFKIPVFEGYGLTETTSFACFNQFPKDNRKLGTVGRALSCNDIVILDDDGKEVPRGTEGEICIRGLNVMREYFRLNEANKKSLRNGFFYSGDYGYIDDDGYIYFKTRKDYLINKGGEKIYPSEIENILFAHPAVDECAVIGVPDKLFGQDIVAFVKLNSDCRQDVLKNFFKDKLAYYKHPREIIIVNKLTDLSEIPKGPTNKVLYRTLLEYYNRKIN